LDGSLIQAPIRPDFEKKKEKQVDLKSLERSREDAYPDNKCVCGIA